MLTKTLFSRDKGGGFKGHLEILANRLPYFSPFFRRQKWCLSVFYDNAGGNDNYDAGSGGDSNNDVWFATAAGSFGTLKAESQDPEDPLNR